MSLNDGGGPRGREPVDPHESLTEKELAREVDRLIDTTNLGLAKSWLEKEAVANLLFTTIFDNETSFVLGKDVERTRLYAALETHADSRMELEDTLVEFVRIGALNQRLEKSRWSTLRWPRKKALSPLAALPDGLEKLRKGVVIAARSNVTLSVLREWVRDQLPKKSNAGRPRGASFTGFQTYAAQGAKIVDAPEKLIEQIRSAPAKKRKKLLENLRTLQQGLGNILAELEDTE